MVRHLLMRRYELAYTNTTSSRTAFTLIEVMVAVMIISVVVASLLKLFSNNTHMISLLDDRLDASMYATLFNGEIDGVGSEFCFENDEYFVSDLVKDFRLEDDIRQKLKDMKVKIVYTIVQQIDAADMQDAIEESEDAQNEDGSVDEAQGSNAASIELGKTTLQLPSGQSSSYLRIRLAP